MEGIALSEARDDLYVRIEAERLRQDKKWGGQPGIDRIDKTYPAVLGEEFGEVCKDTLEGNIPGAVEELVHVAAVAIAWAEQIIYSGAV
jgi:hypothetical protein